MVYSTSLRCLLAAFILLVLASCTGGDNGLPSCVTGDPEPAVSGGSLDGDGLPSVSDALRVASATAEERFCFGSAYLSGGASLVTPTGDQAQFAPDFDQSQDPPHTEIAYAVYGFHLPGYSDTSTLTMSWGTPPSDWASLWVGLGNVNDDSWEWFSTTDGTVALAGMTPYLDLDDDVVVALVMTGTEDYPVLDWLRFGGAVGPVADLTATPDTGDMPLNVSLNATASYGRDGALTNITWDLDNNGLFSEEGTPEAAAAGTYSLEYTFEEAGIHTVTVRVIDDQVLSDTASVDIEVIDPVLELSGTVTGEGGNPLPGVEVALSGDETDTDTTDDEGHYSFELAPGDYTVTPGLYGWFFDPVQREIELTTDVTNADFSAGGPWLHTWGGSGEDTIADLTIDADNSIYAVGRTKSFTSGTDDWEVLIQKFDSFGNVKWIKTWGGTENESGQCAVLGNSGDLYITGYTTSFGEGGYDIFVLKVTPGGEIAWETVWGNVALQEAFDIAVDASENLYVAGRLSNKTLLLKLDSAGQHQWGQLYWGNGSSFNYANAIVLNDPDIYLAGHTYYTDNYNALALKYSTDGALLWSKEWSNGSEDMFDCIGMDSGGGIVCAGHTNNGNGAQDGVIISLTPAGDINFQTIWGTGKFELFYDMSIKDDVAYLAGLYGDSGRGMLQSVSTVSGTPGWGRGFNMDVGSETTTSYAVGWFDNGVFITGGLAPSINGAWDEITGTVYSGGGTLVDPDVRTNNTNTAGIIQSATSGTVTSPTTGVLHTGGGGGDAALYMYLPPES